MQTAWHDIYCDNHNLVPNYDLWFQFNEVFTRLSGKKKAGFEKVKIKSLRYVAFPWRISRNVGK